MATIYHHRDGRFADVELYTTDENDDPIDLNRSEYVRIADDPGATLENVFERWNYGSGNEAQQYLDMQFCPECYEVFTDGNGHRVDPDSPPKIHEDDLSPNAREHAERTSHTIVNGPRSLSVGDVVEIDGAPYMVMPKGWHEGRW